MKTFKRYGPFLIFALFILSAWYLKLYQYLTLESLQANYRFLQIHVHEHWFLSLGTYVLIYITVVAFSIPGAAFMTLAGGILFGQMWGTLCAVLSATLGAQIFFLLARFTSKDLVLKYGGKWFKKLETGLRENGFYYLLTLRFIPIFPFVAINGAAALVQMNPFAFFWGTFLGIIPGSFVYVATGVALRVPLEQQGLPPEVILDKRIWIALSGLGLLSIIPVIYKRFKKNRP